MYTKVASHLRIGIDGKTYRVSAHTRRYSDDKLRSQAPALGSVKPLTEKDRKMLLKSGVIDVG